MSKTSTSVSFGLPIFSILMAALGYFVYDSVSGAIAVFILSLTASFTIILGIIPVAGAIAQYFVLKVLFSFIFNLTDITSTWLSSLIFYLNLAGGVILTLVVTVFIIYKIFKGRK